MPDNMLLINAEGPEHRVALLENGQLLELHIERPHERGLTGNVYKGKVVRVLPGMQAAFVDIGIEKAAFLHVSDMVGANSEGRPRFFADEVDDPDDDEGMDSGGAVDDVQEARIQDLLVEGQEIMVQVSKDPMGTKGARVTTYISLPGRHVVFMPTVSHVGISRRIVSEGERARLREILEDLRDPQRGFIVRTAAEGQPSFKLQADMEMLSKLWSQIQERNLSARAPSLLHADLDLILRSIRDLLGSDVDACLVDDTGEYERIRQFIESFMPKYLGHLKLFAPQEPIFDHFGTEAEIDRILNRKVWLKSGGYLVIDQTEALTAIDVNTGRYVGRRNLEDTITRINLEAVREIATQLRLRNLGGIIIIDFIDMEREVNRQRVWRALVEALRPDRARSNVGRISELCLVEMTRKRTRESLGRTLTQPCFYCDGKGFIKSPVTVCYEILRHIRRECQSGREKSVLLFCHPRVAEVMAQGEAEHVTRLEEKLGLTIQVNAERSFHVEQYEVREGAKSGPLSGAR